VIGQTVSHYEILEEIGAGGMGVVYKAEDTRLKRLVALKFLPPELTRDESAKMRLLHEAHAISKLQHRNICTIHEIDETADGRTFICMDYYEGESLKTRLAHGPLSAEEAIDITLQIAHGLEEAHRHGIVHRDVKPANVMVTTRGEAKILDFGLAKLSGHSKLTKTGNTVGTVPYMSPEQIRGDEVDARSDIFSLGVTLYELLTGATPFAADYEAAVMHKILHAAPPPLRSIERATEIEPVIETMLAKDPQERYQSVTQVIEGLSHPGTEQRPRVTKKRRARRLAVLSGAAAILIVGTLVITHPPWRKVAGPGHVPEGRAAIAVLPFQNLSADGPHAYFAGGLHDEILTQLSKVASLKVISRTSVMGYADGKTPLRQIASELGVGSVVEGSVQVLGERLRVSVNLIDATTDEHLWAERYDRTLDDAFTLQSQVAQAIVAAVGATLGASEQELIARLPTENSEAYLFYLQARDYAYRPGYQRENYENAQQLFERALELDPGFALAHAGLSHVHGRMYWFRYDPSPSRLEQQLEEAEEALRLAPEMPEVHIAMGAAYSTRGDRRRALPEYEIALRSLPNSTDLWKRMASIHRRLGNWNQCFEAYEQAARLDPRDADLHWDLGALTFRTTRRYADSIRAIDRALALAPDLHVAAVSRAWIFVEWQGQLDSLRSVLQRLPPDVELGHLGSPRAQRAELLLWERRTDDLLALLANTPGRVLEGQGFYYPVALYAAWAHRLAGDETSARAQFESALALLDSAAVDRPDDERIHVARGLALAGLHRTADAIQEADWLAQSVVYREDAYDGPIDAQKRARILAQAGAADAALDEIERLLPGPSLLSVHVLRLDPLWDPIREHPRFQALVAKYREQ